MTHQQPPLLRLAVRLQAALLRPDASAATVVSQLESLHREAEQLERTRRSLALCAQWQWNGAARCLLHDLPYELNALRNEICRCEETLRQTQEPGPTLRMLYDELQQIEKEFGSLRYDHDERFLAVTTEPIVLEDVYLGAFEIRLLLERQAGTCVDAALRAVAQDPRPAGADRLVTHPHVKDELVCLGDAALPLQRALASGRICDAFLLVRSVLETYNPDSAYVRLDRWHGRGCNECDRIINDDDSYMCESCQEDHCDECTLACPRCNDGVCCTCAQRCTACNEDHCPRCVTPCTQCGQRYCDSCLENGVCEGCQSEEEADHEENQREQPAQAAAAGAGTG